MSAQLDLARDRAVTTADARQFLRGYRAGHVAARLGKDTDAYLRRLTTPEDAPRIAGYLEGLAAARAVSPQGVAEIRKWRRRDAGPGRPPRQTSALREAS